MTTVDRIDATESESSDTANDGKPVLDVLKRAVIGFVLLTVGLTLLGGVGTLVGFDGAIGDAEADVVVWVAEHRVSVLDTVANNASSLSDTWTVIGVVVGAVSMLWASGHGRHGVTVLLAVLLEFTTFLVVGAVIGRSRPVVDTLNSVPSTPSFPSGHVAAAFVLYGSLVLVARSLSSHSISRALWLVPLFIALLVAAARVYEGVHYPTDVAAGLLLGIGAVIAASVATGLTDLRDISVRQR